MNNSDLLFLYDAKLTNPNGDADDENRPRMDYETSRNLVSDVRLKRYLRDFLQEAGQEIFVANIENKTVIATTRLENLFEKYDGKVNIKKLGTEQIEWMLDQLLDVRLFGATMPIKAESGKGSSLTFTGPVQFNWGYSLNPVSLVDSSTITSHFSSESSNERGTMGKDYRLYYSLIAFHGIISGRRAVHTRLKEADIDLLDQAIVRSIPTQATRSKIGQYPRLYIRVEYVNDQLILGDLRDLIPNLEDPKIREISQYELQMEELRQKLVDHKQQIHKIHYWHDSKLQLVSANGRGTLEDVLGSDLHDLMHPLDV
ncbi:type I-B CRISPR-associated protein Cas7/Csh2 [Kroppenstedtia guangzhouensis]|uniref:Type I-B CRISPR-associated protein Cas7/Csh2 n=1 Tax=Kroppenstedtia guangzhouensis TaxID=1274356 RepID=A0ABQ1FZW5_9BACL|nr:type I-B CRISPR-associated protein Cas7/Csh2 [Kroppenstedtia guangzhouensis]GGA34191.1 type I-B CRISPR-associated protein Cas7/Csh2 [Kroppenstedtia guangzhouensis]